MPLTNAEKQARAYAKRKRETLALRETIADLTDVDWLTEVIADSIDMDWTPRDAARLIVRRAEARSSC